jgi:catechol 2,3-dioxygenase
MPDLLSADTAMGPVTLLVGDLDRMTAYYRDAVGLDVLAEGVETTTLGRAGVPAVILEPAHGLELPSPGNAGLFHTAVLFDAPAALARSVASVAERAPGTFAGSADHLVSRAFYFTDPEGNGVELYTDRPRDEWTWQDGRVVMDSLRLDPNAFLQDEPRSRTRRRTPRASGTSTCRWGTPRRRPPSTSTRSGSSSSRAGTDPRSSSPPAGTTTTWR